VVAGDPDMAARGINLVIDSVAREIRGLIGDERG
jgi:hypothetical protein